MSSKGFTVGKGTLVSVVRRGICEFHASVIVRHGWRKLNYGVDNVSAVI